MKKLRIVFMGTPEFAVTILSDILKTKHEVVGVITAPDKPAGRGRSIKESAVKIFAKKNQLRILQPTNLKNPDFIFELEHLKANVQVIVAFRMLPRVVWEMPELGTFNLHASLLPQYRGAAPINWAIINGEKTTGVTTFFIDDKIDTGEIILQDQIEIDPNENAGDLHDKLMHLGSNAVLKTLNLIQKQEITTYKQPQYKELKTAYKFHNENTKIDWNKSKEEIYNLIRGLNPYPTSWCFLQNGNEKHRIKIQRASIPPNEMLEALDTLNNKDLGVILIKDKTLYVNTKNGPLIINEMQFPGKRKMLVKELINGIKFEKNAKML